MGWPVASKCAVACLAIDESQQPTCPHCAHRRRWNHQPSLAVHSTQPSLLGGTEGYMSTSCWSSMDAPSERPVERYESTCTPRGRAPSSAGCDSGAWHLERCPDDRHRTVCRAQHIPSYRLEGREVQEAGRPGRQHQQAGALRRADETDAKALSHEVLLHVDSREDVAPHLHLVLDLRHRPALQHVEGDIGVVGGEKRTAEGG